LLLAGRFAGRKAVVVKANEEGVKVNNRKKKFLLG
jgi:ribosomal protein L14E/L6E/L27E